MFDKPLCYMWFLYVYTDVTQIILYLQHMFQVFDFLPLLTEDFRLTHMAQM